VKIIAFLFLLLVAFFTVQPLIGSRREVAAAAMSSCCSKAMKCHKESPPANDTKKCQRESCNPFMACAYGNFYLLQNSGIDILPVTPEQEKRIAIDDNRLSTNLSESWHPPRGISRFS